MPRALRSLCSAVSAIALLGVSTASPASAQTYPSQTVKVIVATAAGGVADLVGRVLAQRINDIGKSAIVENRTGAGGAIAAGQVAKAPPDGYTVLVGFHATHAVLPHLQTLSYDPVKDFLPVTVALRSANVLVVNAKLPVQSIKDLVDHAKANPGKLSFASQGSGASGHMLGEMLKHVAKIDIAHVVYRGAAPAIQDLVAGHVSMMFDVLALTMPQVEAKTLRPMMITAAEPSRSLPGIPTARQAGFPQLESGPWFGFFVPAGTPRPIVDWLVAESRKAFDNPESRARFESQGLSLVLGSPEETAAFVASESKRWADIIRTTGIKL